MVHREERKGWPGEGGFDIDDEETVTFLLQGKSVKGGDYAAMDGGMFMNFMEHVSALHSNFSSLLKNNRDARKFALPSRLRPEAK